GTATSSSSGYDYEVFLSFRGPDTREGFTDVLYTSLVSAGIRAYRDDDGLRCGEDIGPKLLQAIQQSKISIPIFSKGYASSKWCLRELAHMVKCRKTRGQIIIPIFYDVVPSEVRMRSGAYVEALSLHETMKHGDDQTIREWKAALKEASEIKGYDLQSMPNRREGQFVKQVVQDVLHRLKKPYLVASECLVGVDEHVSEIMQMIGAQIRETRIIGIHGMGGVGKTTLAKIIYNQLLHDFEHCCFLSNIRETSELHGIEQLQSQLIFDVLKQNWTVIENRGEGIKMIKERLLNKKVLLLLDDVDKEMQLNALMGKRNWFGEGSKLIITTRNKDILNVFKVDYSYDLSCMNFDQSIQLFSRYAFRRDCPLDKYVDLSRKAVEIAGGLPLAIEVIGSLLSRTSKEKWDAKLKMFKTNPREVQSKLKVSYDALDDRQKHVFLDIGCLFIGWDIDTVIHAWDECEYSPRETIELLQHMSLIKIQEDKKLWMHDYLRDLAREITRQECKRHDTKQRRVWDHKEAFELLETRQEKGKVEAICLKFDHRKQYHFTYKDFSRLPSLRFLHVDGVNLHEHLMEDSRAQWRLYRHNLQFKAAQAFHLGKRSSLLPKLRWLSWHNYSPKFDLTEFSLANLAILDLSWSKLTESWDGWDHIKVAKNLKVLNLTGTLLKKTPDLSAHVNLERLILEKCEILEEIDESIGQLRNLVLLNLNFCKKLRRLPEELRDMESLEELLTDGTSLEGMLRRQGDTGASGSMEQTSLSSHDLSRILVEFLLRQ
ncbi:ADP-ribosyl cyclase/cyclic ADP-ribose hydrolase, partial [Psidium guajava]